MTKEQILKEFKDFELTETQIEKIVQFYRAGADLLSVSIGQRVLTEDLPLKLTLNNLKHAVVQILELRNEEASRPN